MVYIKSLDDFSTYNKPSYLWPLLLFLYSYFCLQDKNENKASIIYAKFTWNQIFDLK